MPASYPSSAKTFTTKSPGQTIDPNHINDLQLEVTAIENDLIAGLPIARGGTGLTAALAANRIPYSTGSAFTSHANLTFDGSTFTTAALSATTGTFSGALTPQALVDVSGASAGQVKFPGTQNASSDVNTLDDYEEGTWTPTIGGSGGQSGQAYSSQVGRYVKIGRLVTATFFVQLSTLGTITSNVQVKGLPFTAENVSNQLHSAAIGQFTNFTTSVVSVKGAMLPNTTAISILITTAAAVSNVNAAQADLSNTTAISGTISYVATA